MFYIYLELTILGLLSGFISSALGTGGSTFLVPILMMFFSHIPGAESEAIHFSIATALSITCITSLSGLYVCWIKKELCILEVKKIIPPLVLSCLIGFLFGHFMPLLIVKVLLFIFLLKLGIVFLFNIKIEFKSKSLGYISIFVGIQSGILGISGGNIAFAYFYSYKEKISTLVSLSTLVTFVVSGVGCIIGGSFSSHSIHYSVGYIYMPGVIMIVPLSLLGAKFGLRLSDFFSGILLKGFYSLVMFLCAFVTLFEAC
jgi:uncharacterized protein